MARLRQFTLVRLLVSVALTGGVLSFMFRERLCQNELYDISTGGITDLSTVCRGLPSVVTRRPLTGDEVMTRRSGVKHIGIGYSYVRLDADLSVSGLLIDMLCAGLFFVIILLLISTL